MKRYDVINYLIRENDYKSYLEIGLDNCETFLNVECENKESIDPYSDNHYTNFDDNLSQTVRECLTYRMTSDEAFASMPSEKKYDIIFVDGLHTAAQVAKDILNSMQHLNKNGKIVVHDCIPSDEASASETIRTDGGWNGSVWKTMCSLKKNGFDFKVVDVDYGCGIIEYNDRVRKIDIDDLPWSAFETDRHHLMNIISCGDFYKKYQVKPTTISTCLIVKNESVCIDRCLKSVYDFSDEIIIYDTGSNDGTQDMCKKYDKVKLIQGEWRNDFAWARNNSVSPATSDYIFWVDADDVMDEKDIKWMLDFKKNELIKYDMVNLEYIYDMDDNGNYDMHFYRERLMRRSYAPRWFGPIHEYFALTKGTDLIVYNAAFSDVSIKHHKHSPNPKRNWEIYRKLEEEGRIDSGRDWFYYGRECMWVESDAAAEDKFNKALQCPDLWYVDALNLYMHLADICARRGDKQGWRRNMYLAASCTDVPRADVCCALGNDLYQQGKPREAARWLEMACGNTPNEYDGTFMDADKDNVYPSLYLCQIYYELGDMEKSHYYNDLTLKFDPDNKSALYNKQFFE